MAAIGGSSLELRINGRPFSITADADIAQKLKKFDNEVRANGNGTVRLIKVATPQMLDGIVISIDDSLKDLEFLSQLNDSLSFFDFNISLPSGSVYAGKGQFTGDLNRQSENAAAQCSISCSNLKVQ